MTEFDDLLAAAMAARARAYAPYSRFAVGAALRAPSGAVYAGCNVENASYPLGLCAEASAIAAMVAAGERRIRELLVAGGESAGGLVPCGACRQRILEFADRATRVVAADSAGNIRVIHQIVDLLPHAFRFQCVGGGLSHAAPSEGADDRND